VSFPCSVASPTAPMACFKMLLNGAVSSNSHLGSADASDFYLGADLPSPGSIKIHVDTFGSGALDQLV
jgi:hypothetical protein